MKRPNYYYLAIFVILIAISISSHLDTRAKVFKLQESVVTLAKSNMLTREVMINNVARDTVFINNFTRIEKRIDSLTNILK